jgi:hypothetical protein
MSIEEAFAGFEHRGQFFSALQIAHNLGLPFEQVKARMLGQYRMSLGETIRDLRPEITDRQAGNEVRRAEIQARAFENQARDEERNAAADASAGKTQ